VVLALLLGNGVAIVLVAALSVLGLHLAIRGRWPPSVGYARSGLEIFVPGMIGWMTVAGPKSMAASAVIESAPMAELLWWIQQNWTVPVVFLSFTLVHYGLTAARRREQLVALRRIANLGYVVVITSLAIVSRPFHAGLLSLLFVIQWPFQAAFQSGYVRWHWQSVQLLALLAMFIAALGARNLP
jgi:hypothetical protein